MTQTAKYLTDLKMEEVVDAEEKPLKNREGKQLYSLLSPLSFYSAELALVITAEAGFITDLDSTPRIPLVYLVMNAFGDMPAATHDYLYSKGVLTRAQSDAVLREACLATGVAEWKADLVYEAVRVGGASHFNGKD